MISGAIREGAKVNFEIPYLFRRQVWSKNQKTLSKREKLQKCLKFDSGCAVQQIAPQNQFLKITFVLNFVG